MSIIIFYSSKMNMYYLVTWSSGFIWFHVTKKLLEKNIKVIWFDNENDYYDPKLKKDRRCILMKNKNFIFIKGNLENYSELESVFKEYKIEKICHLWAQAGVRYSIENPHVYIQSNIVGFVNIMELARIYNVKNIVYASSSSVYWDNKKPHFSILDRVDTPQSLYAATKKSNELIAYSYSSNFWISTVWLRFFTVYGPRGRPDMAYFKFLDKLYLNQEIEIYGKGKLRRDFTYIDDIVDGIIKALEYDNIQKYSILNLWNDSPISISMLISYLEAKTGKIFIKKYLPIQLGDVKRTRANIRETKEKLWWSPTIKIEEWLEKFIDWYKFYYWK